MKLQHSSVLNFVTSMVQTPGFSSGDVIAAVTTICFDIHVNELWAPLLAGAEVRVVSREIATDGNELAALLVKHNINKFQATPSTFRLLIEAGWPGSPRIDLMCGGEPMTVCMPTKEGGREGGGGEREGGGGGREGGERGRGGGEGGRACVRVDRGMREVGVVWARLGRSGALRTGPPPGARGGRTGRVVPENRCTYGACQCGDDMTCKSTAFGCQPTVR